jgi:UPF0755 protein
MKAGRKKLYLRVIASVVLFLFIAGAAIGFMFYRAVYKNNTTLPDGIPGYLFIKTGATYDDLINNLEQSDLLINTRTFEWLAVRKNLPNHVYPGRYEFRYGMSNNQIVDMLRSGAQKPLNVTFNNIRTYEQFAGKISQQIEADSIEILQLLNDDEYLEGFGFNTLTASAMFIPNTYQFYWNTSADGFFKRMFLEYERFWDETRLQKAGNIGFTPVEVSIIASIVDRETNKNDEKARIAGVYINRLKKNWKLQADPTTVYAVYMQTGELLNRVLRVHTLVDSPYNTYVYAGLPPGPICVPSIAGIDAVLNFEKHDYMFFVANADMSGYHRFSTNYNQHLRNAREYQAVLNQQKQIRN